MEVIIFTGIVIVFWFINKMALRTSQKIRNEALGREIQYKLVQNKKLDELYGRNSGCVRSQLERAIKDIAKNKKKIEIDIAE